MSAPDLISRIRLIRSGGIGPVSYRQLLARVGSAENALAAIPDLARRGGGQAPVIFLEDSALREVERVKRFGARYLVLGQGLYPRLLAEIDDAAGAHRARQSEAAGRTDGGDRRRPQCVGQRRAASRGSWRTIWAGRARWSYPDLRAGSTRRPMMERSRA